MAKLDRRGFLKTTAKGLAAVTAIGVMPEQVSAASKKKIATEKPVTEFDNIPDFKFNANGKFKVMQIADTHFVGDYKFDPKSTSKRYNMATPEHAERALRNITSVLETEKPDLVIHTGDIIYSSPAKDNLKTILSPMGKLNIPFAVTLGNHDEEFDLTRQEVFDFVRTLPSNINTPSVKDIHGASNNVITLSSHSGKKERIFYLLDSGRKFSEKPDMSYDFLRYDQIAWYNRMSEHYKQENGGANVPALTFMHIPLLEYVDGIRDSKRILKGNIGEEPGCSQYNSGMFASGKARGDIEAYVFGHDHDNDSALLYKGVYLIYGRFSGYDSVYSNLKPEGVRLFEFTEGQAGFHSWIRLYNKEIIQDLNYPEDFKSSLL